MVSANSTAYLVCSRKTNDRFANCIDIGVQNLKLYYAGAGVVTASNKDKKIILLGRVVDSADPNIDTQQIAEDLVKADDVSGLISRSRGLAGRFIILYVNEVLLYVLPDAVASVPITFTTTDEMFIASNPRFIAEIMNWTESAVSREIKSKAA